MRRFVILARMIGATRQSISLILSRLQDDGIISTGATKVSSTISPR
ncbi:helix-turn-helix domain-containing protein [Bradyrhizobium sp. LB12.1]